MSPGSRTLICTEEAQVGPATVHMVQCFCKTLPKVRYFCILFFKNGPQIQKLLQKLFVHLFKKPLHWKLLFNLKYFVFKDVTELLQ